MLNLIFLLVNYTFSSSNYDNCISHDDLSGRSSCEIQNLSNHQEESLPLEGINSSESSCVKNDLQSYNEEFPDICHNVPNLMSVFQKDRINPTEFHTPASFSQENHPSSPKKYFDSNFHIQNLEYNTFTDGQFVNYSVPNYLDVGSTHNSFPKWPQTMSHEMSQNNPQIETWPENCSSSVCAISKKNQKRRAQNDEKRFASNDSLPSNKNFSDGTTSFNNESYNSQKSVTSNSGILDEVSPLNDKSDSIDRLSTYYLDAFDECLLVETDSSSNNKEIHNIRHIQQDTSSSDHVSLTDLVKTPNNQNFLEDLTSLNQTNSSHHNNQTKSMLCSDSCFPTSLLSGTKKLIGEKMSKKTPVPKKKPNHFYYSYLRIVFVNEFYGCIQKSKYKMTTVSSKNKISSLLQNIKDSSSILELIGINDSISNRINGMYIKILIFKLFEGKNQLNFEHKKLPSFIYYLNQDFFYAEFKTNRFQHRSSNAGAITVLLKLKGLLGAEYIISGNYFAVKHLDQIFFLSFIKFHTGFSSYSISIVRPGSL